MIELNNYLLGSGPGGDTDRVAPRDGVFMTRRHVDRFRSVDPGWKVTEVPGEGDRGHRREDRQMSGGVDADGRERRERRSEVHHKDVMGQRPTTFL